MSAPVLTLGQPPRVDLMPRAEIERRERNALLARWLRILLLVVIVVAVAIAGTFALNVSAGVRLAIENARTQSLLAQIASMQDTRTLQDLEKDLGGMRTEAMATDADWTSVIARVQSVIPAGVEMTGFELNTGTAPVEGVELADATGVEGTLSFTSGTPLPIVDLSRAVLTLDGVVEADAIELTSSGEGSNRTYAYVVSVIFDQSIYTGRFADKEDAE